MNSATAVVLAMAAASVSAYQPMMMAKVAAGSSKAKAVKNYADKFLRLPEPNAAAAGEWYVKDTEGLSKALPWVTAPVIANGELVGDAGFDPLGLATTFDVSWLRAAELKHGRIAMLSVVGFLTPELVQHPIGYEGFKFPSEFSEMNAIKALSTVPQFGLAQIIIACGLAEIASFGKIYNSDFGFDDSLSPKERENIKSGRTEALVGAAKTAFKAGYIADEVEIVSASYKEAGDLGFDPLGFADGGVTKFYAEAELRNGRLAMIASIGMLLQSFYAPDKGILQQTIEWAQAQA